MIEYKNPLFNHTYKVNITDWGVDVGCVRETSTTIHLTEEAWENMKARLEAAKWTSDG